MCDRTVDLRNIAFILVNCLKKLHFFRLGFINVTNPKNKNAHNLFTFFTFIEISFCKILK